MSDMNNDADFRKVLETLDDVQQRQVAALFVEHVLHLSEDKRLERVVKTAVDAEATEEEIAAALLVFERALRCYC